MAGLRRSADTEAGSRANPEAPDRDETRFAEIDERRGTATAPEVSRDSIQRDPLAERAEIERHSPRAQRDARWGDLDRAPADQSARALELSRRRPRRAALCQS